MRALARRVVMQRYQLRQMQIMMKSSPRRSNPEHDPHAAPAVSNGDAQHHPEAKLHPELTNEEFLVAVEVEAEVAELNAATAHDAMCEAAAKAEVEAVAGVSALAPDEQLTMLEDARAAAGTPCLRLLF